MKTNFVGEIQLEGVPHENVDSNRIHEEIKTQIKRLRMVHYLPDGLEYSVRISRAGEANQIKAVTQIFSKEKSWNGEGFHRNPFQSFYYSVKNMNFTNPY